MYRFCLVLLAFGIYFLIVSYSKQPVYYQDKAIVLTYHHLDFVENDATLSPSTFAQHLDTLIQKQYNIISMETFVKFIRTGEKIPPNAVVLTFDDGYESFYTYAYPELKKRGISAANFLVMKSTDVFDPAAIPHLTWNQIQEMKANGMSFYSHTYDHHRKMKTTQDGNSKPMLANRIYLESEKRIESQEEYKMRIKADLELAEKRLFEELGEHSRLLAYPYGAYNETVIQVAAELGYELFFTVEEGINDRNQRKIFRINTNRKSAEDLIETLQKYSM
ncbi:polysaccharide deacetylase family protein [Brevibacillus sp. FSL K6-6036]|uniref:polysaccharide deacetylase family protein n=1 Tax=Brevibacillus TaxID=55080 RepID=UPI0030CCC770